MNFYSEFVSQLLHVGVYMEVAELKWGPDQYYFISHLNWVCIFLGFHSFGLYIHNDTMSALGRP